MAEFDASDSLGSMSNDRIAEYFLAIGDGERAKEHQSGQVSGQGLFGRKSSDLHTGCIIGFIPSSQQNDRACCDILGSSHILADELLQGTQVKISLDKFYAHSYPGFGAHTVLCEFTGMNQLAGENESLRFTLRFRVNDKGSAAINGLPIFLGVTVGKDGVSFEGRSINIGSAGDDVILETLERQEFKSGLSLLTTAQPALKPFVSLAEAVVKSTLKSSKNKQVHSFNLGLDFSDSATSARLALGSYVIVQRDVGAAWNWADYEWNRDSQMIQVKSGSASKIDFNFMIIGVSRFQGVENSIEEAPAKAAKRR